MLTYRWQVSTHTARTYLVLSGLILAAWIILAVWQRSEYVETLGHEAIGSVNSSPFLQLAVFLLGWLLMTIAMMLPGSLPMLNSTMQRARSGLAGLIILGYLLAWVLFGLLVYFGDLLLHQFFTPPAPLSAFSTWITPAVVLVAGAYQFTPAKRGYLERCKEADILLIPGSERGLNGAGALQQGLRFGSACVGTCWSLMLLMSAIGHQHLGWMLALGGIMAAERLAPGGRRLSWLVGLALVVWAVFLIYSSSHAGHSHH